MGPGQLPAGVACGWNEIKFHGIQAHKMKKISFINFLTALLLIMVSARVVVLYSTIDAVPRFVDETCWLQGSYFYDLLFIKRNIAHQDWFSPISYDQPPISKYIFGFALHATHQKLVDSNGGLVSWHNMYIHWITKLLNRLVAEQHKDVQYLQHFSYLQKDLESNQKITLLDPKDYRIGRLTVLLFAVCATMLLIGICFYVFGHLFPGALAGLLFLSNSITIPEFQMVMPDSIWCLFVLLSMMVLFRLFHAIEADGKLTRRVIVLSSLEGLVLSLAAGTKLITVYMLVFVLTTFVARVVLEISRKPEFLARRIVFLVSVSALTAGAAILFFIACNPYLYHDPLTHLLKMMEHRLDLMQAQHLTHRGPIRSFSDKLITIFNQGILLEYGLKDLSRKILCVGYLYCAIVGAQVLIRKSFEELRQGFLRPHTTILFWVTTTFIVNGSMISMKWQRYYIPFVMCSVLVAALGAWTTLNKLIKSQAIR
jgi:hypothetical protein